MPFKANNRYLIRIYYHECRIALEAHHSLGDGSGGMYVLQTITAVYLRLLGHSISTGGFVLDVDSPPDPEELEDAYMRYANAQVRPPRPGEKAYRVRGTKEPFSPGFRDGTKGGSSVLIRYPQRLSSIAFPKYTCPTYFLSAIPITYSEIGRAHV